MMLIRKQAADTRPCPCCEGVDTVAFTRKVYKGYPASYDRSCECNECGTTWRSFDYWNEGDDSFFERLSEIDQKC